MSAQRARKLTDVPVVLPTTTTPVGRPSATPPASQAAGSSFRSSGESAAAAVRAAESVTSQRRKSPPRNTRTPELPSSEVRTSELPNLQGPKYLQLERKDTLLWPGQLNELTLKRRQLNRQKPKGEGERITENTLIRVAIDLLLANGGKLAGSTEDELRRSLGLRD